MKDMHSFMMAEVAIAAAVYSADEEGAAIDKVGFEGVEFLLNAGAGGITFSGTNKVEVVVEDSADNVTYAVVEDADILGATVAAGGIVKAFVAAHATGAAYRFGYKGDKRYVRATLDFSGTHGSGTPFALTALKFNGHSNPQADQI